MKVVRIEIPGAFLDAIGATEVFAEIESLEVLNAYQYDCENFFSMQKLRFKPGAKARTEIGTFFTEKFHAHFQQVVEERSNEVTYILKQNLHTGFFKLLEPGPWAILFPMLITHQAILVNILAQEEVLPGLYTLIERFTPAYKVISTETPEIFEATDPKLRGITIPWPKFSSRQKEILAYASSQGYFNSPKKVTAEEIAAHFHLSIPTVNEHLRNAENIAIKFFFGGN